MSIRQFRVVIKFNRANFIETSLQENFHKSISANFIDKSLQAKFHKINQYKCHGQIFVGNTSQNPFVQSRNAQGKFHGDISLGKIQINPLVPISLTNLSRQSFIKQISASIMDRSFQGIFHRIHLYNHEMLRANFMEKYLQEKFR